MTNFKTSCLMDIYLKLYSFYGPQHWWPADTPLEVAVGAILTQNTNWLNVEKAIKNLKDAKVLSVKALYELPIEKLSILIRPAGYFNVKAKRLKAFIDFVVENYGGTIERMMNEDLESIRKKLLSIHGIGNETADSILLYALNKPLFVIDVYTKRILSRHNIMDYNATYEEYQNLFHREIDEDIQLFKEYHALLVQTGKKYCKAKPLCEKCPLNNCF